MEVQTGMMITFDHPELGEDVTGKIRTMSPNGATLFVEVCGAKKFKFVTLSPGEVKKVFGVAS